MTSFIELTSSMNSKLKWFIRTDAISFIRKKDEHGNVSILLMTSGTIEPAETYDEVLAMLKSEAIA